MMLRCECGKALRVPDDAAGKKVRCPACQAVLTVPAEDLPPIAEVIAAPAPPPPPPPRRVAAAPEPEPPPAPFEFEDEPPVVTPRPKGTVVGGVTGTKSGTKKPAKSSSKSKPWKNDDANAAQPAIPPWAWVFVVACGAIPVVAIGGAIPMALGFGGAGGCIGLARDTKKPLGLRVGGCVAITVLCWALFGALLYAVLNA